jgi:hypothetical protein
MRRHAVIVLAVCLFSGCLVHRPSGAAVVGQYDRGGFNESTSLELRADHTYRISQIFIYCMLDENGNLPIAEDEETGTWEFREGVVVLQTAAVPPRDYYGWFARLKVEYRDGDKVLVSDVADSPVYQRSCFSAVKDPSSIRWSERDER